MAYKYDPKLLTEFENVHDLELVQASPIEQGISPFIAPLNFVEMRGYFHRDEFVLIGVYPDGSFTPYKVWK